MILRKYLLLLFIFIQSITLNSQQKDSLLSYNLSKSMFWVIYGSAYASTMTALYFAWYKSYESTSFHWFNDAQEWQQMDKFGHIFSAYQLNRITHNTMLKAQYNHKQSLLYSALISYWLMNSIEFFDGFSVKWGASVTDILSNTAGVLMFSTQQFFKKQIASVKFSYHYTSLSRYRPDALGKSYHERILKDYNGQTYWLSLNINSIFPSFYPKWLNVCFGYSANNMLSARYSDNNILYQQAKNNLYYDKKPYRRFFISLDIQPDKIQTRYNLLNKVFSVFHSIKIPFPAIEINKHQLYYHFIYF